MATTNSDLGILFQTRINGLIDNRSNTPEYWRDVYQYVSTKQRAVNFLETRGLGLANIVGETQQAPDEDISLGGMTTIEVKKIGKATKISQEALDDNDYIDAVNIKSRYLLESMNQTKNTLAMDIFNRAFDSSIIYGDGQPLCSTVHPYSGGVFSNKQSAALSQTSLQAAISSMSSMRLPNGFINTYLPSALLVPSALELTARTILGTPRSLGSNNNDENPINKYSLFPKGVIVNPFLTNPNVFFIITTAPDGFIYLERQKLEITDKYDTDTQVHKFTAWERYGFGVKDVRATIGFTM